MAFREPVDPQPILEMYAQTGSGRETARRLGLHENTVYAIVKRAHGKCPRCGDVLPVGHQRCKACRDYYNDYAKKRQAERRRRGVCVQCDEPIKPPSVKYCATHRLDHIDADGAYQRRERAKRRGTANEEQHQKTLRAYGPAAFIVWDACKGACVLCRVPHDKQLVFIHHLDGNRKNNVVENMTCLCLSCHRMVHVLTEHTNPAGALCWIRAHYPQIVFD